MPATKKTAMASFRPLCGVHGGGAPPPAFRPWTTLTVAHRLRLPLRGPMGGQHGLPTASTPPTLIEKFPNAGSGTGSPSFLVGRRWGEPWQAFSRHGGRACPPPGAGGVPLPWSAPRARAGRRGEAEARSAPLPLFLPPQRGGLVIVIHSGRRVVPVRAD